MVINLKDKKSFDQNKIEQLIKHAKKLKTNASETFNSSSYSQISNDDFSFSFAFFDINVYKTETSDQTTIHYEKDLLGASYSCADREAIQKMKTYTEKKGLQDLK